MKIKTLIATVALVTMTNAASAAHIWEDPSGWWTGHFTYDRAPGPKFNANEFTLDLFGSYIAGQRSLDRVFDTNIRDGVWGGGVGLNYFVTRIFGVGADINMSDNGGNLIDVVSGNAILRLPIESVGIAPYLIGGGGRTTDVTWEWYAHAGVGLEARFTSTAGIFIDGRYIWPEESSDALLLRAGLRVAL